MGNDKHEEINSVYDYLFGKDGLLCMYQKNSVEKICDHLKTNSRALLADEVGLGKTYIAKGIIAKMVSEYYKKDIEKRPYRVGYICPNQEIAEQNYKKLRLYSEYSNPFAALTVDDYQEIEKLIICAKNVGLENCVYTRILDWLLDLKTANGDVNDFFDNLDDAIKSYYVDKQEGKGNKKSKEWSKQQNLLNSNKRAVVEKIKEYINDSLISKYIGEIKFTADKWPSYNFYYANINFIEALNGGIEEDSRLSMSHLFSWERDAQNNDSIMIIDALTSQTSFNIKEGNGTIEERALLQATISVFKEIAEVEDPTKLWDILIEKIDDFSKESLRKNKISVQNYEINVQNYENTVRNFINRLRAFKKQLEEMKNGINLKETNSVPKIRRAFIEYNVSKIQYDLMILDEFQNFRELIDPNYRPKNSSEQNNVAYKLVNRLLAGVTKTVLLSATPFSIDRFDGNSLVSYLDGESEPLKIEDIYAQFEVVIKFLINNEEKAKRWFHCWKQNRLTVEDIVNSGDKSKKNKCEELLFEAGVFRNEREYASKAKMIDEKVVYLDNDISYLINANKCLGEKADCFRSEYGLTPWALSFIDGIKISSSKKSEAYIDHYINPDENPANSINLNVNSDIFNSLFLTEAFIKGDSDISKSTPEYKKLKEITLGDKNNSNHLLLWIPPCNPTKELSGVYKGKEGFSKTLVFCKNQITPKSLTYLLANDCLALIKKGNKPNESADEEINKIKEYIEDSVNSKIDSKNKLALAANEIVEYIINQLFEGKCIWQRVILEAAKIFPELQGKPLYDKVKWYFESGGFEDMIGEYFTLLKNEYGDNSYRMKAVVRRLNLNEEKEIKIYVYNKEKMILEPEEFAPACGYAIGMYNSYDSKHNPTMVNKMSHVKKVFNSPFWPFVMISTSIGTEGIDLHWYARNIVHWSLPAVAGDIEQREGRILRFDCHAIRLNENVKQEDAVRQGWENSGMYPKVIRFAEDRCYYINRYIFVQKNTPFEAELENKKNIIDTYRIMLGQQEIVYNPSQLGNIKLNLAENYICLSPYWKLRCQSS